MATVADLRNGRTQDELTNQLSEVIAAVEATGKKGSLTFTINVAPAAKNSTLLKIEDTIVAKAPTGDRSPTLMFVDDDHNLSLNDPSAEQARGNLRDVSAGEPRALKEVSNG
jgi:hypothetical protein